MGHLAETYIAIELGAVAEDIFESARTMVDAFVGDHSPRAADQLVAINERMSEQSIESRSAAPDAIYEKPAKSKLDFSRVLALVSGA
jgi:hypothetical protein